MRLSRLRFTARRMMAAVATVGISSGAVELSRRTAVYTEKAHRLGEAKRLSRDLMHCYASEDRPEVIEICRQEYAANLVHSERERRLRLKYKCAARNPWLPFEPDPPMPE